MEKDTVLYFHNFSFNGYQDNFLNSLENLSDGSKFFITMARRFRPSRFVTRNGEWSLPWNQELIPKFRMPEYDPAFKLSFSEVTDLEALTIKSRIHRGEKFAVLYSGGIDSTVVLASLIKNLSTEELKSVSVCASIHSIVENPSFFYKYILNKLNIIDSNSVKCDDLIEQGYIPITADEGDPIFGTMIGLNLYYNFDTLVEGLSDNTKYNLKKQKHQLISGELHYSVFKDLIIKHLSYNGDLNFGKLLYEKYVYNSATSSVPIHSVHDFFWWLIFNVKYLNCSVRAALYFNDRVDYSVAIDKIYNWYNSENYQLWSMNNNNNGEKIKNGITSYKSAARDYIYSLDKNEWYKTFKLKLESLNMIVNRQDLSNLPSSNLPIARIGFDKNFNALSVDDPKVREYFTNHLANYKIDWI